MNPLRIIPAILRDAVDELFPNTIDAAGEACRQWRPDTLDDYCPRCGASAGPGAVTARGCSHCLGSQFPWQRVTRLSAYAEPVDGWIRDMKYHRQWRWAVWLGEHLAQAMTPVPGPGALPGAGASLPGGTLVCPVPMHWSRRWRRGYNQAALIAREIARQRHWTEAALLRRIRATLPQTAVAPSKRAENVRRAFAVADVDLTGHDVVLVDDVKTTGSTLNNCARLLRSRGARTVRIAVVAVA